MNVYDSDRMQSLLVEQGFRQEPSLRDADVILINTCSIRDKAEHKVLSLLGELKPLKDKSPHKVIGITGCIGQRLGRSLLQRVPHLDLVMGPDSVDRIGVLLKDVIERGQRVVEAKLDDGGRSYTQPAVVQSARPVEYLTVMKGCDHFCTYCIVPFVRGREKSRTVAEIIEDVRKLVEKGTKEVTFLGQNINTYGKGTGESLAQLVTGANQVAGLERIRYVTSHPRDLGDDLIAQFGTVEKLCPALHLPFQSGSDAVLKRMSRLYTRAEYLSKVEKLRLARPDIALSGDVIVGFPGETEEDFTATLSLMQEVQFSNLFLFKYSPRPGTRAFSQADDVPESVKSERLFRAQAVAFSITRRENESKIGSVQSCLVEGQDLKAKSLSGRTPHNKLVHIQQAGPACVGKTIDVKITEANTSNLKGFYVGYQPAFTRSAAQALSAPLL